MDGMDNLARWVEDVFYNLTDNIGPRMAGTNENVLAGSLLSSYVQDIVGLVDKFKFKVTKWIPKTWKIRIDGVEYKSLPLGFSPSGNVCSDPAYVYKASKYEFESRDVYGKIAIATRGGDLRCEQKYRNITEAGAIGFVQIMDTPNGILRAEKIASDKIGPIPAVEITYEDGMRLLRKMKKGVNVNISIETKVEDGRIEVSNIIGGDIDRSPIILTAHFDSWFNTPGAFDNASGVISALLAAKISKLKNIAVILFNAEEFGLLGSKSYSREKACELSEKLILNLDVCACKNSISYTLQTNSRRLAKAAVEASDQTGIDISITSKLSQHSDHWPFAKEGLKVGFLFQNSCSIHTHTSYDTPEKVGVKSIIRTAKLVGKIIENFINKTSKDY